jgi:aryl-alcohol dehydrogenase
MKANAAVLRRLGAPFAIEEIELADPKPDELLIRIVSAGICGTDIHRASRASSVPLPIILGHEGSGVVEAIGAGVTGVELGDLVVLTFAACQSCVRCKNGHPAYCERGPEMNLQGTRMDGSTAYSWRGEKIFGHFVGVSSFATHSVVHKSSVVVVSPQYSFDLLAMLGCGVQTGAGTVLNVLPPPLAGLNAIAVLGVGTVGLSAVMAARAAGWGTILVADLSPQRLDLASEFGATHTFVGSPAEFASFGNVVTGSRGLDAVIDTTGHAELIEAAVASLALQGRLEILAPTGSGERARLDLSAMLSGRIIGGSMEGDSRPVEFIPALLQLHENGGLPVDRLISRFTGLEAINEAMGAAQAGDVVKAIVRIS